ncbi:unnamed protein product [Cuscuta campestris]|uniref:Uncharacterized protein n=1 Tax=Cuscuta campestris TaxID=132261 RepID=A0A484LV33_9ASTE|nr:unnamed protein product [Cuscuta campestris]
MLRIQGFYFGCVEFEEAIVVQKAIEVDDKQKIIFIWSFVSHGVSFIWSLHDLIVDFVEIMDDREVGHRNLKII